MLQVKKQIKSGRDLCQFSSGDLEAKLGIRHILHRKKVFIFDMIQSWFFFLLWHLLLFVPACSYHIIFTRHCRLLVSTIQNEKNLLGVFGSISSPTRKLRPCRPPGSPVGHQVGNFEFVNLFVFGFWPRFWISIHSACFTNSNKD